MATSVVRFLFFVLFSLFTLRHCMVLELICLDFFNFIETPIRFWPTIEQMLLGDLRFSLPRLSLFFVRWATLQWSRHKNPWNLKESYRLMMMDRRIVCGCGMLLCVPSYECGWNKGIHVNGDRSASCWRDLSILVFIAILLFILFIVGMHSAHAHHSKTGNLSIMIWVSHHTPYRCLTLFAVNAIDSYARRVSRARFPLDRVIE